MALPFPAYRKKIGTPRPVRQLVGLSEADLAVIPEHGLTGVEIDFTNEVEVATCNGELPSTVGNVQRIIRYGEQTGGNLRACGRRIIEHDAFADSVTK